MAKGQWIKFSQGQNFKYYKGNIVYQATYDGKVLRYNLYKISKSHYNEKTIALLRDDENYNVEECVRLIDEKAKEVHKAFGYIVTRLPKGKSITKKDIDNYLVLRTDCPTVNVQDGLVAHFEKWINKYNEEKRQSIKNKGQEVKETGTLPGTKDFYSCLNLLKDFEYDNFFDYPITLQDIDDRFVSDLISYCYDERVSNEEHQYKTQGNLVNRTIQKRLDCLFQYLKDITKGNLPNAVVKPHLDTIDREIIRLDKEEIEQVRNMNLTDEERKVRDYFLFLCYTGLRFGDFYKLNKTYYNEEENIIKLKSNKTFSDCQIPLHQVAKEIAFRYQWNFSDYTNQALNRAIHLLFEKYNLFEQDITMEYMQAGRKIFTKKKRELISCHTGRRTFISRLIEDGADVYDVMSCTGHKKYETLKFYVDKFGIERKQRLINMINRL